jgi:hypothetical protein
MLKPTRIAKQQIYNNERVVTQESAQNNLRQPYIPQEWCFLNMNPASVQEIRLNDMQDHIVEEGGTNVGQDSKIKTKSKFISRYCAPFLHGFSLTFY